MKLTKWSKELIHLNGHAISNVFIVHGNIGDYAYDSKLIPQHLREVMIKELKSEVVLFFDISTNAHYSYIKDTRMEEVESKKPKPKKEWDYKANESLEKICSRLMNPKEKMTVVFRYPEYLFPVDARASKEDKQNIVLLDKVLNSSKFLSSENVVIFLTETTKQINEKFINSNAKSSLIYLDLPDKEERQENIEYCLNNDKIDVSTSLSPSLIADLTAGLTRRGIEDLFFSSSVSGELNQEEILNKKTELIQKEFGDALNILNTGEYNLDMVAGLDYMKDYLYDIKDAYISGDYSVIPKGILWSGPPGTGKTYVSECFAGEAGINFVKFDISKIMDKYVGETEKKLEKMFRVLHALAPVGVFMDEVDQQLDRGESDSNGVRQAVFGMFLQEMYPEANRGKILWLAATNYPERIDAALKRDGRFDINMPFLAPNAEDRLFVFKLHVKKASKKLPFVEDVDYDFLVEKTEGYTQMEVSSIVIKALQLAKRKKEKIVTNEHLKLATKYKLSGTSDGITHMENQALLDCSDLEFLPEAYYERRLELIKEKEAKEMQSI